MDIAASIQKVCEEVVLRSARHAWERAGRPTNLVMAGGVALNCVANGRLLREGPFERIWIQPASGDAGGALGAALFVWHQLLGKPRQPAIPDSQQASLLGPSFTGAEVRCVLDDLKAAYRHIDDEPALLDEVAGELANGKIVGWFHGRAEFGPRALGARSILADPRNPRMQADLNLKIKFREGFRPFAPCVLREHVHDWFEMRAGEDSAYMLQVAPVRESKLVPLNAAERDTLLHDPDLSRRVNLIRSVVPAITHVDSSARIQTVDDRHGRFQRLLRAFHEKTGCPILVNTSFNLSWEPIVLTPREAYRSFMQSEMDVLVLENCVLRKSEQRLGLMLNPDHNSNTRPPENSPWADPQTGEPLIATPNELLNSTTGSSYAIVDGIPRLYIGSLDVGDGKDRPRSETRMDAPSANSPYRDVDTPRVLLERMRSFKPFQTLGDQLPYGARIVEIGCGAGTLTNFLSISHRSVLGMDPDIENLRAAQAFKTAHNIERAAFAHMNLAHPALREEFFDVVISHPLRNDQTTPPCAFTTAGRLLRNEGYFLVFVPDLFGSPLHIVASRFGGVRRVSGWPFRSQFLGVSLNTVIRWMRAAKLDFVNAMPMPTLDTSLRGGESLFTPCDPGTAIGRLISQLAHSGTSARWGGTILVIGQRQMREARRP